MGKWSSWLRYFYLSAKRSVLLALEKCSICGQQGVESTSLRFPQAMCSECDALYNRALYVMGSSEAVEKFISDFGVKAFILRYDPWHKSNPMADLEPTEEEEEIPNFDTFPDPVCTLPNKPLVPYPGWPTRQ